jgi:hypothetical protein
VAATVWALSGRSNAKAAIAINMARAVRGVVRLLSIFDPNRV